MIKVETISLMDTKRPRLSGDKGILVRQWQLKYGQSLLGCKINPDRKSIIFHDDRSFEVFKNTYKGNSLWISSLAAQLVPLGVGGYRHRLYAKYNKKFNMSIGYSSC